METAVSAPPIAALPVAMESRPLINPWIVAVVVTRATFMELLDTAIANVALPDIAGGSLSATLLPVALKEDFAGIAYSR